MNILFLSIGDIENIMKSDVYTDLMREFNENKHSIYIVCGSEKRRNRPTKLSIELGINILRVKIGNITKTNLIEKGISTLLIEKQFLNAINKYYSNIKFDLVLYSTPPITFCNIVSYIKKRDNAKTYLMLKDIFPQNAVDLGMFSKKSIFYKYFSIKEKKLYNSSDYIGCMSKANVAFLLSNNAYIDKSKVEICPNSVKIKDTDFSENEKIEIRSKYNIPLEKKVFIYGGNLGKPQGIDFLIECLKELEKIEDIFVIVVGSGTEFGKIDRYITENNPQNIKLLQSLQGNDYDNLVLACDIGMIFLDKRFTIPNFPSRLLSYMQAKLPVLAVTDVNTDIKDVILEGEFGIWCEAGKISDFKEKLKLLLQKDLKLLGENSKKYLIENYTTKHSYDVIMKHFEN